MPPIAIRPAARGDAPTIHRLIVELARHERAEHEVAASAADVEISLFAPDARGRGAGRRMLVHLAKLAVERGCGRFEWNVLDWNAPAIGFYESLGARPQTGWVAYRLEGEALARPALSPDAP